MKLTLERAYADQRAKGKSPKDAIAEARKEAGKDVCAYYPDVWRHIRKGFSANGYQPAFEAYGETHMRWIEKPENCGLRFVGYADDLSDHIKHTGWYTDDDGCDETVRGVVYQLPARNGQALYVPGYVDSWNDGAVCLAFSSISEGEPCLWGNNWDDEKAHAARDADHIAERMAEESRDHNRAWQAGNQFFDADKKILKLRDHARTLIDNTKLIVAKNANVPTAIGTLKCSISTILNEIQELRDKRATLHEDYGDTNAFKEGAQIT